MNNAGIASQAAYILGQQVEEMDRVRRTNLRAVFLFCRLVIPYTIEQDYGRIVNVASIAGKEGNPRMVPYPVNKTTAIGLAKSLGKELAGTGIRVNCGTPVVVRTRLLD
jgi:3-oxoacyl-[acyl-carrier protein] reductase